MDVDVTFLKKTLEQILTISDQKNGSYVCLSNVHMCMEIFDYPDFRCVVNQADLILPDGKPLSIAQKLLGHKNADQVSGQDVMNELCQQSGDKNFHC